MKLKLTIFRYIFNLALKFIFDLVMKNEGELKVLKIISNLPGNKNQSDSDVELNRNFAERGLKTR